MVTSYYLYSNYIAGFFPKSYAMIWFGLTAISPILAFICWYAKGNSKVSFVISSGMIAVLFNMTFSYGLSYFDLYSILELIVFLFGLVVLRRKSIRELIIMIISGVAIAIIFNLLIPFHYG